jgi:hypothetical protein
VTVSNGHAAATTSGTNGGTVTVTGLSAGRARLTVVYQRLRASGAYRDVHQGRRHLVTVARRVIVIVRP